VKVWKNTIRYLRILLQKYFCYSYLDSIIVEFCSHSKPKLIWDKRTTLWCWEGKIPVIESQKWQRNNTDSMLWTKVWNVQKNKYKFFWWNNLSLKMLNTCVIESKYVVLSYNGVFELKDVFLLFEILCALVIKGRHTEQFMGNG